MTRHKQARTRIRLSHQDEYCSERGVESMAVIRRPRIRGAGRSELAKGQQRDTELTNRKSDEGTSPRDVRPGGISYFNRPFHFFFRK